MWNELDSDVQNAYTICYYEFGDVYNTCFPMKILSKVIEPGNHGYPKDEEINKN